VAALRAAHARLLHDTALQFAFPSDLPPKLPHEPEWMKALGRVLAWALHGALPFFKIVFWSALAAAAALILFLILREIVGIRFARRRRSAAKRRGPVDWRPEAWKARALLEDADRLAASGAFDAAAHLILHRSIEDIEGHRPRMVRPALTARDIAAMETMPASIREAFSAIARAVETSFFGGRHLDAEAFAACRQAYEAFAFPQAWA
jgi:hypothetical protein